MNGRIICPSSTEGSGGWQVHFEISDDLGKHGKWLYPLVRLPLPTLLQGKASGPEDMEAVEELRTEKHVVQAIQPSILKHKNGKLQVLCRTRNGKVATTS